MFGWLRRLPAPVMLESGRIMLREPKSGDYAQWADLRGRSRAYLTPWEPVWDFDELTRRGYRRRMRRQGQAKRRGTGVTLFVFEQQSGRLAGGISVFDIRHGVTNSARIGYWMGESFAGQGLMTEALKAMLPFCFGTLGLHRVEAACIPRNERSKRVLEKAGFEREGIMRSYLRINGLREDHYLYARLAPGSGALNRD